MLDRLDHFVKERLGVRGYARYMDDFVLFADDKPALRRFHEAVEGFVDATLHLRLKERATVLAPVSQGLPFLGWRIYRGVTRLRPENLRRTRRRLRHRAWEHRHGRITEAQLADAVRSVCAHLEHGNTRHLRRSLFSRIRNGPAP